MLTDLINRIKCIHRHTIEEHPQCFLEDKINIKQADKLAKEMGIPWYQVPGMRIGILDIEADGLTADFATMLTWCIKVKDGEYFTDVITKQELFDEKYDERIVRSLVDTLKQFHIVVGYYSGDFHYDIPFIRTKALHYGIDFPGYGSLYQYDLYTTVKAKLSLSRRSLDNTCNMLNIEGKTPINRNVWKAAKYGNVEALKEVLEHNKADCKITEELYEKLIPFRKWMKASL